MAPKPALDKGRDHEHNLLAAASDEAHLAGKDMHADEMSEAGSNSVVSYSDYSNTDNEGDELEVSTSSSRKERRSRRRRASSRRRKSSRSRSRDGRSKSVERRKREEEDSEKRSSEEEGAPEDRPRPEEEKENGETPRRPSQVNLQGMEERTSTTPVKAGDQPYAKLLNFNTLYRTEQDRAPRFTEELERITANWVKCKEVLQSLLDEVKHANHLFHVSDVSFHQYSHVMYTIHKDIFLDDQGQRVLSSARQQLLLKQRGANNVDGTGRDEPSVLESGYLDPLYNSFSVLTDTMMKTVLERESDNGKQSATIEFQEFCEELVAQAEAMRALGDSVVQEMEGSEMDIQNSFDVLTHMASKLKNSKTANVLDEDIKLGKPDKNFPKEMEYGGSNACAGDWWLCETLYRAAVKHQQVSWDTNEERMKSLEDSLKYFQEKHREKLEKAVLAVMPQQREMFLVGAKAFDTALKKTDAFSEDAGGAKPSMSDEQMAEEFERNVQKHSASLMQKKSHHKSAILNRSKAKYSSAIEQAEADNTPLPAFGSPVMSKLVLEAKVLERWEKPGGWLTTVAIFTVDRYLHLFDCSDLDTKTLPQTAFSSMFPTAASSRANVHHQGGGRRKTKRATENKIPSPSLTFNLVTCTLKTYGYARRSFEIKQVADPTQKSKDLPHTTLRFKDNPEAQQWYALLQDLPDFNPGPVSSPPARETEDYDRAAVEAEASRQKDLYDDVDAAELPEVYEKESDENEGEINFKDASDHDNDEDDFEDASEYDATAINEAIANNTKDDGDKKGKVKVETVDEGSDDDSFQSC